MTTEPVAIAVGETWTARYDVTRATVLEVTDRHVQFEASHKPGKPVKYTRAQFLQAFRPPMRRQ